MGHTEIDKTQILWSVYWLAPFAVTSFLYIGGLHWSCFQLATVTNAVFKCLPMFSLILLVWKIRHKKDSQLERSWITYKSSILLGLIFGTIGDWCLVFPHYFVWGMLTFAIGHIAFIKAYGFTPLRLKTGILIFSICTVLLLLIRDQASNQLIRDAMPFYSLFLVTMCWRAIARADRSFARVAGAIGGVLFVISDFFLVLQMQKEFPYGRIFVITTYYLSQLCTSLSVLDSTRSAKKD